MPLPVVNNQPQTNRDPDEVRVEHNLRAVNHVIGVHSGKGGVGKTFLTCNLALFLAREGHQVGLLDADIDCPNVDSFFNIKHELLIDDAEQLVPVLHNGIKIISTGFIKQHGEALVIRGPIKHQVLLDFLGKTAWGALDYLLIDFPPGTSDVPLSAMQYARLSGIILVATPQKESRTDLARAVAMARALNVPILGLVENMSGLFFGSRGESLAKELDVRFLGSIPLTKGYREAAERGEGVFHEEELAVLMQAVLGILAFPEKK